MGNFFPEMGIWDNLSPHRGRGAGGLSVKILFPGTGMTASMSGVSTPACTRRPTFMARPGHCYSGGVVDPAPRAPGGRAAYLSVAKPPCSPRRLWYHQHFNLGDKPYGTSSSGTCRSYLALATIAIKSNTPKQDPCGPRVLRRRTEKARQGEPHAAGRFHTDRNYQWNYGDDD